MATHAVVFPIREHTQEPGLGLRRHVANFIKEKRASSSLFKAPDSRLVGPSKGTLFVAE